jgi:hypothetical protein
MSKAKVKATQEEVQVKTKKSTKIEVKEVHVAGRATSATAETASKKRKDVVAEASPVEQLDTKLKGKRGKKAQQDSEVSGETGTTAPIEVVAATTQGVDDGVSHTTATAEKKKPKVAKVEKPSKLLQQVLNVDKNGLSIMPIRVRRMLLDVVLNQKNKTAEKELSQHKDALLEASNLKEGYLSYHGFTGETLTYLRELVNVHLDGERTKFERRKVKSLVDACPRDTNGKAVVPAQLQELLDTSRQLVKTNAGGLTGLYQQYDKKFYKDFTESHRINNLTGEDAYRFYKSLISRDKIRLNLSGNLKLTAFVELVLRHVVAQASVSCVANGKTTLNISNMAGSQLVAAESYLFPIAGNLSTWGSALSWLATKSKESTKQKKEVATDGTATTESTKTVPTFVDLGRLNPNNKFKYNSYIVDLCKNVSRSFITTPPTGATTGETQVDLAAAFGTVKISGEFRNVCNQLLIELLHSVGNILKVIINTGKDRTITAGTVDALIQTYHLAFNLTDNLPTTLSTVNGLVGAYNTAQATLKANKANKAESTTA